MGRLFTLLIVEPDKTWMMKNRLATFAGLTILATMLVYAGTCTYRVTITRNTWEGVIVKVYTEPGVKRSYGRIGLRPDTWYLWKVKTADGEYRTVQRASKEEWSHGRPGDRVIRRPLTPLRLEKRIQTDN